LEREQYQPCCPSVIDRITHREQALRFDWACKWVESFGIKLNPARVAIYRRDLKDLADHVEAGTGLQFEKERGLENLINSVVEAQELIEIYAGLKNREDAHLADLLRKYIGGTPLRTQETPLTSLARNTGFHLWFVSNAAKCEVPIDLTPPADATIPTSDYSITVECKRLFSPRNIKQNIKKGFQQLQKRYKQYDRKTEIFGVLALSLGKLGESLIDANDEADLRAQADKKLERFRLENERHWLKRSTEREIGVFLHWTAPVRVKNPYLLISATNFHIYPLCQPDTRQGYILRSLRDRLHRLVT
jgi:hypothetical protein